MTDRVEQKFDALEWHDAVVLNLEVPRHAPGDRDEVVLLVEWLDGRQQRVRFSDCYALDAQMNFGMTAPESIRSARCVDHSQQLSAVRQRWADLGVDLGGLRCFEFTMNSTASIVRIFALEFETRDVQNFARGAPVRPRPA